MSGVDTTPRCLLLIGASGAGKTTQGSLLSNKLRLTHLPVGDILRAQARRDTFGMHEGATLPDALVAEIMKPFVQASLAHRGCVLDGFPRGMQGYRALLSKGIAIDMAISISVDPIERARRLRARQAVEPRADETPQRAAERAIIFASQTQLLIGCLAQEKKLIEIDGNAPAKVIENCIVACIRASPIRDLVKLVGNSRRANSMTNLLPFTQHDQICDSSLPHGLVEHTTSWLSINPIIGCSLECAYCFRYKWGAPDKPVVNSNVADSVDQLISHPEFKPSITPITANISSTDAMLPAVKSTTFECMSRLDSAGYSNIFGITTKCGISEKDISFLTGLQNLRVIVLVTYSAMPRKVEPYPAKPRLDGLRLLAEAGVPRILYYRPIVPEWNTDSGAIRKVLSLGRDYAQAISMGGLRMSPEIRANIEKKGLQIPDGHDEFHEKLLPPAVQHRINEIYEDLGSNVPLYKHTSCAVSYVFGLPNYNNLFERPLKNCTRTCPVAQQRRCGTDLQQQLAVGD